MTTSNPLINQTTFLQHLSTGCSKTISRTNIAYRIDCLQPTQDLPDFGYLRVDRPPQTRDEATLIRLDYRTMYTRIQNSQDRRLKFLDNIHNVIDGRPVCQINGIVTDAKFDYHGQLERLCLMGVSAANWDTGETTRVDTHAWLFINRMRADATKIIDPTSGLGGDQFTISLGDMIGLECTLNAYATDGMKRIGVDQWTPVGSALVYADRRGSIRNTPRHLRAGMELVRIHDDTHITTIRETEWWRMLDTQITAHKGHRRELYDANAIDKYMPLLSAARANGQTVHM